MEWPGEKLLIKMWDTLAEKGIGSLLTPWQEKRVAKAQLEIRKEEMFLLAKVEMEVEAIKNGRSRYYVESEVKLLSPSIDREDSNERIEPTIDLSKIANNIVNSNFSDSVRKEINVSKAILHAEDILKDERQEATKETIEDDWLFTWRKCAGNVSTDELQSLWGKVLAGEVKQPGSYSLRTLDFLKGLSKTEAKLISKIACYVIFASIIRIKEKELIYSNIINDLIYLQEIGIITGVNSTGLNSTLKSSSKECFETVLISYNKAIVIRHEDVFHQIRLPLYKLTEIGKNVIKLADFETNMEYLKSIAIEFVNKGYTVFIGDWTYKTSNTGNIGNPIEIKSN